jgi:hypothetical protein
MSWKKGTRLPGGSMSTVALYERCLGLEVEGAWSRLRSCSSACEHQLIVLGAELLRPVCMVASICLLLALMIRLRPLPQLSHNGAAEAVTNNT